MIHIISKFYGDNHVTHVEGQILHSNSGATMGILMGLGLFYGHLEQKIIAFIIGTISLATAISLYLGSIYYLLVILKLTDEHNDFFIADDWQSHKP